MAVDMLPVFFEGRELGINTHEVSEIKDFLYRKLQEKSQSGAIPSLSQDAISGFTRKDMAV